jgi:hypothetical protein
MESGRPHTAEGVAQYLRGLSVTQQTRLTYLRSIATVLGHMYPAANRTLLTHYGKALVTQGAAMPAHPVVGMSRYDLATLVNELPTPMALVALIMWKAAARFTETAALTLDRFVSIRPDEVIIDWGQTTKSARLSPFRPDRFTVIVGEGVDFIYHNLRRHREGPLLSLTGERFNEAMTRILGRRATSHMIKHGAVSKLMGDVAMGIVPIESVMRLAKHRELETTVRYAGATPETARALGTARVTMRL